MGKGLGGRPGHGEHKMQGNAQLLRDVHMRKTRRICDDGIGDKRLQEWIATNTPVETGSSIKQIVRALHAFSISRLYTRSPASGDHFIYTCSSLSNVAVLE